MADRRKGIDAERHSNSLTLNRVEDHDGEVLAKEQAEIRRAHGKKEIAYGILR